jgi:hypothetical protein
VPDDLSSIEGLADKHLRALARLGVTDLRGLVQADQGAIYRAMASLRPRPTHEQISRWQDDARSKLGEIVPAASDWQTAASFVVVFSQRHVDDTRERRVEAERTEVEPERNPQVWSDWDCEPVCEWMLGQLSQADGPGGWPAAEPAQLNIDSAAIIDATGRTDVVTAGAPVPNLPTELVAPVRVVFAVSGAPPGARLRAVTRIQRPDGTGWNPQDPVVLPDSGQAEFDLALVPAGDHELSLIAWAPDATAKPVSVRLPGLTIRPDPGPLLEQGFAAEQVG